MSTGILTLPPKPLARKARGWLLAAICLTVTTLMLMPLVMSLLASFRPLAETSAVPPTYLPSALSTENYLKVANHQQGIWTYVRNSTLVAGMTIPL